MFGHLVNTAHLAVDECDFHLQFRVEEDFPCPRGRFSLRLAKCIRQLYFDLSQGLLRSKPEPPD